VRAGGAIPFPDDAGVTTYVVLLRGVNVGGARPLPMAGLRDALTAAGHRDVRTYVQSGNVVLSSRASAASVTTTVHREIADVFGLDVPVVVRTAAELADVAAHNPFHRAGADPGRQLHVAFLAARPADRAVETLDPHRAAPEELHVRGREIYLWCPDGLGRSKVLTGVERALDTAITVRNWRTVTELLRLAGEGP
jgi:uncharacterized protein (DUF1697 family)